MKGLRTLTDVVGVSALGIWVGVVGMTSATAGVTFPVVKRLDPHVPGFDGYTGEHWLLVAGRVMYNVFFVADVAQAACAVLAVLALVGRAAVGSVTPAPVWPGRVRLVGLVGAIALLVADFAWLKPTMNRALLAYWEAARAGDNVVADAQREAFRSMHPTATAVLLGITALVLVALVGWVWRIGSGPAGGVGARATALQSPALLGAVVR
jgi:hypothetical protein